MILPMKFLAEIVDTGKLNAKKEKDKEFLGWFGHKEFWGWFDQSNMSTVMLFLFFSKVLCVVLREFFSGSPVPQIQVSFLYLKSPNLDHITIPLDNPLINRIIMLNNNLNRYP